MESLRTPHERFVDLPGYPFDSHFVDTDDLDDGTSRVHFLDVGPVDDPVVLAMHGAGVPEIAEITAIRD